MQYDNAKTKDDIRVTVKKSSTPARNAYRVLSEDGLRKNGKIYEKGEIVRLDAQTAAKFKELDEVENV